MNLSYGTCVVAVVASGLLACSSPDGAESLPGCARDDQCKGDRICIEGACVDPDGEPASSSSSGKDGGGAMGSSGSGATGGAGGEGAGGSTPMVPNTPGQPVPVEAACIANCDAKFAADCYTADSPFTPDQCLSSCLFIEESRQGYCLLEDLAVQECEGLGGYTCANERPVPNSACLTQREELAECTRETPCAKYCDDASARDCSTDRDACFDECMEQVDSFYTSCQNDYTRLVACWQQQNVCPEDRATSKLCYEDVAEVAWCLETFDDDCLGYCWAGELLECAPSECHDLCVGRRLDSSCGSDWGSVVRCAINSNDLRLQCSDGVLTTTIECKSDRDNWDDCVLNATP